MHQRARVSLVSRRRGFGALALAAAVVFGPPSPAYGQGAYLDSSEEGRFQLGSFSFTPAFFVTGGYDTNVTSEPGAIADYELVTVPQVEAWYRAGRLLLNGVSAAEFINYRVQRPIRTFNHFNGLSLRFPGAILEPRISASHRNHFARPTGFEIGERSRRIEDEIRGSLSWSLSERTALLAEGRWLRINWDAAAQYRGSNLRESLNRTVGTGELGVSMALTPLTAVSLSLQLGRDRFEFSPERDGNSLQAGAGVSFASPALISGSALVAYRRFDSPHSDSLDFDGVVAAAHLAYIRETRTRFIVAVERQPYFSYAESLGYYLLNSASAKYVQTVLDNWEIAAFGGISGLDYRRAGLPSHAGWDRTRHDFGGGLTCRIGAVTRIGVNASRTVSRGGLPYDKWRVIAFLAYGSDRLQRLDRPLPDER